jgi:NAD-specific glutamate dehydrogenase
MADHTLGSEELKTQVESLELYLKHYQLLLSASIVILMQLGFTFLEVYVKILDSSPSSWISDFQI